MIKHVFDKLSIKKKLIITIMSISSFVLFSILGIFITNELINLKKTTLENISTLADLVGKNSYAAIMFIDTKAANENLTALKAKSQITSAHLYVEDKIFASYHKNSSDHRTPPEQIITLIKENSDGYYYTRDHIHLLKRIIFEADKSLVGFIYIKSNRELYWQTVVQYIYTTIIMIGITLLITLLLAYRAQKIFTKPLLILLESMHHVTSEHKYTKTIDNKYYDEFGKLVIGYNNMLNKLEEQHQLTIDYQYNLEQRVEERTLQLQTARDEALSASRLKSIFLANMSHEIRTPMNAILGYAQLLQQSEMDDEQRRKLGIIDKSGNHLLSLINDILELSKIEAGSLEINNSNFDLKDLIHSVENMFKIRCEQHNITWRLECFTNESILVNGDQGKLRQILINLLGNACKFTEHGEILFKIEKISDNQYQFLIKDTGMGIEEHELSRIFDAFHQEKQGVQKGGTGLGLSITKRYVELISGKLKVKSIINQGSTFYFDIELLPANRFFTPTHNDPTETYSISSDRQLSALVVEDNSDNTELLSNILSQLGFNVICAENGQEGLDEIKKACPDIVFMDIRMPVMDGFTAIKIIRQQYSTQQLKCIAVTASAIQGSSQDYLEAGFNLYITKPYRFNEIVIAVKNTLGVDLKLNKTNKTPVKQTIPDKLDHSQLKLDPQLVQELMQAAEFSQLTELKELLLKLKEHGPEGEIMANHLELLINTADLDGIIEYVKGVIHD